MANHSATIDSKTIKAIFEEMEFYRKGLVSLRKKLLKIIPEKMLSYGSDLWWEKSEIEAEEDIRKEKISRSYTKIESLIDDLHKGVLRKT